MAVVFATMSGSAGLNLAADIERGYFDKLLATPVSRLAILVGAMAGDLLRILAQAMLVTALTMVSGVDVATGALGAAVVVGIAPLQAMADWLRVVATLNPVTYILDGMRALTVTG